MSQGSPAKRPPSASASEKKSPPSVTPSNSLTVQVVMLDDTINTFHVSPKAFGRVLYDQVCKVLNLFETDYFGLEYSDANDTKYWLDYEKPMQKQMGLSLAKPNMTFAVKFYTPDPAQLEEEFTRYLFSLQIKRDLADGTLQCTDNTTAILVSYVVQASCGDFVAEDYPDHSYLSSHKFVPQQDEQLEIKIMENHKRHVGMSPSEADMNLLEAARRCELYGIRMTQCRDPEGVPHNLAVAHMGIIVFLHTSRVYTFSWAKIRKLSFKRKKFLIKLHPEGIGYYKEAVEFLFNTRNESKNFWKKCIEHHAFFRCTEVKNYPKRRPRLFSRGSSFRYSGRTQKQVVEYVREHSRRCPFQRSHSLRLPSRTSLTSSRGDNRSSLSVSPSHQAYSPVMVYDQARRATESCITTHLSTSMPQHAALSEPSSPRLRYAEDVDRSQDTEDNVSHDSYRLEDAASAAAKQRRQGRQRSDVATSPDTNGRSMSPRIVNGGATTVASLSQQSLNSRNGLLPHRCDVVIDQNRNVTTSTPIKSTEHFIQLHPPPPPQSTQQQLSLSDQVSTAPNKRAALLIDGATSLDANRNSRGKSLSSTINANGVTGNGLSLASSSTTLPANISGDVHPPNPKLDKAYFVAKELLMTERTYKKDLEVITMWFRDAIDRTNTSMMPIEILALLFNHIDPLYKIHCALLRDFELKLAQWEGRPVTSNRARTVGVGDVINSAQDLIPLYEQYVEKLSTILERLYSCCKHNQDFQTAYREFEQHNVCYLPFAYFVIRPMFRLQQYAAVIERLIASYDDNHPDRGPAQRVFSKLKVITSEFSKTAPFILNFVKLMELENDLVGVDNILQPGRQFLREGCLLKLSRKGYQQRLFFLFSDMLVYAGRSSNSSRFKVRGELSMGNSAIAEPTEPKGDAKYCFTVYAANRALMVAAFTEEDRQAWLAALKRVSYNGGPFDESIMYSSLQSCTSSDERLDRLSVDTDVLSQTGDSLKCSSPRNPADPSKAQQHRSVVLCWHRHSSVGADDLLSAAQCFMSGYLLRKFKSSAGWQKLWVVYTHFCFFFYKSYQDSCPLASLPLLGYTVGFPDAENDGIQRDCVFKLQHKTHVYFFRAESEYTFKRWIEAISTAAQLPSAV